MFNYITIITLTFLLYSLRELIFFVWVGKPTISPANMCVVMAWCHHTHYSTIPPQQPPRTTGLLKQCSMREKVEQCLQGYVVHKRYGSTGKCNFIKSFSTVGPRTGHDGRLFVQAYSQLILTRQFFQDPSFSPSLSHHLQPPAGEGGGGGGGRTGKQLYNFRVSFFNIKKGLGGESVCYSALS